MFPLLDLLLDDPLEFLQIMLYRAPGILIALVLHEWAHAYVAYRLGDPTAKMLGRLTVNPLKHFDPLGTFMLFFLGFGYAKPVPINPNYFKNKHRDDFFVSIAGITMNLLLYLFFITLYYLLWQNSVSIYYANAFWQTVFPHLVNIIYIAASINLSIALFNVLPIPPLDGFHIFNDLLIKGDLFVKQRIAQYGMGILMLLSFTGLLGKFLGFFSDAILDGTFFVLDKIFGA